MTSDRHISDSQKANTSRQPDETPPRRSNTYGTTGSTRLYDSVSATAAPALPSTLDPAMTTVDDLWYLADEAAQQAEQTYHRLSEAHSGITEFETTKRVSRRRFRTVAERIRDNGAPYGAHTLAYRPSGEIVLVRHEGVDLWVLPGGEAHDDESFRTAAERELAEEAGLSADYDGLAILGRVTFQADDHTTWGVLPVFAAEAEPVEPTVEDPDDEISAAEWFEELPPDTRDRHVIADWLAANVDTD